MAFLQSFKKKDQEDMNYIFKDTFKLIEDRQKSESPALGSIHSSTSEMSKLEDRQLRRSFQAIQRPETPPSPKEDESGGHFNLTFRDTITDTSGDPSAAKVYNRQSSVDSEDDDLFQRARSSGMGSAESSFVQVTPRDKIGSSKDMEDKLEELTAAAGNTLWDASPESSVHVVPQYTRERTPDTTASRGNLIIGGSISSTSASLNRNKLDATMRDQIRDVHRDHIQIEETSFSPKSGRSDSNTYSTDQTHPKSLYTNPSSGHQLGMTMRDAIRDRSGEYTAQRSPHQGTDSPDFGTTLQRKSQEEEDEKIPPCWPRCIAVGIALAVLLAGIVALIVVFDEHREQEGTVGKVIDDPIPYQECGNIKVNLTDRFNIHCMFAVNHDTREGLTNSSSVTITFPNRNQTTEDQLEFKVGNWSSNLEETATCATIGQYKLRFTGVVDEFKLNVTLESSTMTTNLDQTFFNDTDGSSEFRLECRVSGDCTRYRLDIVGIHGIEERELNENLTCMTRYSNTQGISLSCTANIPDSIVSQYSQIRCKISSPETATKYSVFKYPDCGKMSTCPIVNCTEGSDERKQIEYCGFVDSFVSGCFHPGRKVYSFCKENENSCSCKMNWCQSGRRILKNEVPGQLLCGDFFQPINYTARPTTEGTTRVIGTGLEEMFNKDTIRLIEDRNNTESPSASSLQDIASYEERQKHRSSEVLHHQETPQLTKIENSNNTPSPSVSSLQDIASYEERQKHRSIEVLHYHETPPLSKTENSNNTPSPPVSSLQDISVYEERQKQRSFEILHYQETPPSTKRASVDQEDHLEQFTTSTTQQKSLAEEEDENIPPCWPRCLAVAVSLSVLLMSIVALTVVFSDKDKEKSGEIIDDKINYQECRDVLVRLGDHFTIDCMLQTNHDTRTGLENITSVSMTKPDRKINTTRINITNGNWSSDFITATCAHIGKYILKFDTVSDNQSMTVFLEAPVMVTSLDQVFKNDTYGTSTFYLGCNVSGDCTHYSVDIVGIYANTEYELDANLECSTQFSDTKGTSLACNGSIPDALAKKFYKLSCKISSLDAPPRYKDFKYPDCGKYSSCRSINCTVESDDRKYIDICRFGPKFIGECFPEGRKIYSFCRDSENECSCKMNWCQSGRRIYKDNVTGSILCEDYKPRNFTAWPSNVTETPIYQ